MRRTVEVAPDGPRPSISLRPVPPCEPPFDDELEPVVWATAHQLALDWSPLAVRRAPRPATAAATRLRSADGAFDPAIGARVDPAVGSRADSAVGSRVDPAVGSRVDPAVGSRVDPAVGSRADSAVDARLRPAGSRPVTSGRPGVAGASQEAKTAVHRFLRLCVEVLNGHRPPTHLRALSRPADAAGVVAQGRAAARRVAELRRAAHAGRRPPRRPPPTAVIRLRMCEPRPGAVEAAVALVTGERTWAMALRLEQHQESWAATTLRLI